MKIELLVEREPFWDILKSTLSSYYQFVDGKERTFHVRTKNMSDLFNKDVFLVNSKINSIFNPHVNKDVFGQIKKEFSYHPNILKRWLQTVYINLATTFPFSYLFADHILEVEPSLPHAEDILILGGNNRLRIMDLETNTMIVILKEGFSRYFFDNEVMLRKSLKELDIPKLIASDPEHTFFVEKIISGTPINRLHDDEVSKEALEKAMGNLQKIYDQTIENISLSTYLSQLQSERDELLKNTIFSSVSGKVIELSDRLLACQDCNEDKMIALATTHGDFQVANILLDKDNIWLIDWENAKKRSVYYDALTFSLYARVLNLFYSTFTEFYQQSNNTQFQTFKKHLSHLDENDMNLMLRIFLVENLIFALQQNDNEHFYSPDGYLFDYLKILEKIIGELHL